MTKFNDHPTTEPGLYGNAEETYFVNSYGVMFVIQSQQLTDAKATAIVVADNRLPVDCVTLNETKDITIPEWCVDWQGDGEAVADNEAYEASIQNPSAFFGLTKDF